MRASSVADPSIGRSLPIADYRLPIVDVVLEDQ
jgi:hypothetical protein